MSDNPELIPAREAWCERNLKKWTRRQDSTWGDALCPIHNEDKPSLTVNLETGGFKCLGCNASGVLPTLAERAGLSADGLPVLKRGRPPGSESKPHRDPSVEYVYDDVDGNHIMKVCRYEPKDFRQFHWAGAEWKSGLSSNTVRVPYKLPKLVTLEPSALVFWVEGEKDVDALWALGFAATTSPGGAKNLSKIRDGDMEVFRDRRILVVPDNDQPGRDYADMVCERLEGLAQMLAVVKIPNLPPKGDFCDWLAMQRKAQFDRDGIREHWVDLVKKCSVKWKPKHVDTIYVGGRDLHDISDQATQALLVWNDPPKIFSDRSGALFRVQVVDGEIARVGINSDELRGWMSESARWRKETKSDEIAVYPDVSVAKDIWLRKATAFPQLDQVVRIPVFDKDMKLVQDPGYHASSKLFVSLHDLRIPEINMKPTKAEVAKARGLFLDDLLADFPFVDDASRAHALSAILLPFVRRLTGATPLHLIESPQVSNGKTLLAQVLTIPASGRPAAIMSDAGEDEAEWRKSIQSTLQKLPIYVLIDNVGSGGIESDTLAAVLTSEEYEGRELGTARNVCYPNRATWVATGNNLHLKLDIARRTMFCRIDSKEARPWERSGFRHPQLCTWALENRSALVWAALTLCQNWIAQGAPRWAGKAMGSFELHNQILGGILEVSEVPGFLQNYNEQFRRADTVSEAWESFLFAWWNDHHLSTNPCTAHELAQLVEDKQLLDGVIRSSSTHGRRCSLGRHLQGQIDRLYGNLAIRLHKEKGYNGLRTYRIEKVYPNGDTVSATPVPQPVMVPDVVPEELF